jgi:hypothetical protein
MKRARTERPENFEVDLSHLLMRGAVLLGLGQAHHSIRYRDESDKGNHGTLTGYTGAGNTPADRWGRALGRFCLSGNGTSSYAAFPAPSGLSNLKPFSLSLWAKRTDGATTQRGLVSLQLSSPTDQLAAVYWWDTYNGLWVARAQASAQGAKVGAAFTQSNWNHFVVTSLGGAVRNSIYVNGRLNDAAVPDAMTASAVGIMVLGNIYYNFGAAAQFCDLLIHDRVLSVAEINMLADPSNVMLSGAIREPGPRRSFVGQVAAKPWLYAHRRSSRVIGVGI